MATLIPVILAGGKGERFWPVSRLKRPKQFLCLDRSGRSLLQTTADRLLKLTDSLEFLMGGNGSSFSRWSTRAVASLAGI